MNFFFKINKEKYLLLGSSTKKIDVELKKKFPIIFSFIIECKMTINHGT